MTPAVLALAQFAPSILRFFGAGTKPAAVVEKVLQIAREVTDKPTPEAAAEAMKADPELARQYQIEILAADEELEKAALADVDDARKRDLEVRRMAGGRNTRADLLVLGAVLILLACLVVLIFFRKDIPGEAVGIISTIAGIAGACMRDAFQFEFGSSRGSKDKDAILAGKLQQ